MSRKPPRSITGAIRRIVVPALHERGFAGELPHLRRATAEGTSTFAFQIDKYGGRFIVELGRVPPGPYTMWTGDVVQPADLTSFQLALAHRARVHAVPDVGEELWFEYASTVMDRLRAGACRWFRRPTPMNSFERAARRFAELLPECDRWWAGEDGLPHVRSYAEQERLQYAADEARSQRASR